MIDLTMQDQLNAAVFGPINDAKRAAMGLANGFDGAAHLQDVEAVITAREEESRRVATSIGAAFTPAALPPISPEALAGRRGDCYCGFGRELARLLRESSED